MLTNLRAVKGGVSFNALLERGTGQIGGAAFSADRFTTLTYYKSALATPLKNGDTVTADSTYYTAGELADMEKTTWTVDGVDSDDGHLVRVFVR